MIILLGESAGARELSTQLKARGLELIRKQSWTEETSLQTPSLVIDASHPSTSIKFAPLRQWCEQRGIPYIRLERPETKVPSSPLIFPVYNWEEALLQLKQRVDTLHQLKGRPITIFITTGSHQLQSIANSSFARSVRLVVRILPEGRLVQKCNEVGIHPRDIVAMQGPFSKEINRALFKFYGADILLTRDSGLAGGTDTKISAALELGLEIVLVKKTKTNTGLTVNSTHELLDWIDQNILDSPITQL
ncbi:precorrin-6A/cobalt-precorrin-6A reductase [Desulfosporosinus metallidurans]|uniref:Cobalt-precorrin-6x reductase n=1 Tax=Desulfosporosinus metallidurans TaxID=1888891 RepID=A0A1Q8QIA0_9FIRM|nr:precorrin-6A/cobalt-precorrin-6A reductase [Desulfosporosinus metallidurans]OLN27051.1 Cobalt-precorrin-6x reductase [Desulfosporosinus metallidurans]